MPGRNPKDLICEAQKFEIEGFLLEASRIFEEAIELLKNLITATQEGDRKLQFLKNISVLDDYVLKVKKRIETKNRCAETVRIPEGATGFSYLKLFGPFLDETVKEVHLYESFVFEKHQIENVICFLDLLVKKCKNLRFICLFTKRINPNPEYRKKQIFKTRTDIFNLWIKQFSAMNIVFRYRLRRKIHDRRVEFGNGTTFVLGYGLDIYQSLPKLSIGTFDYDLRKCKETYVEILRPTKVDILNKENLI